MCVGVCVSVFIVVVNGALLIDGDCYTTED